MTIKDLMDMEEFSLVNMGENQNHEIANPFCCDLLSFAMSKMPGDAAWVTVMGNINTLAVAALTDVACIILAEGAAMDLSVKEKAKEQGITVFSTQLPIFEAANLIYKRIHA